MDVNEQERLSNVTHRHKIIAVLHFTVTTCPYWYRGRRDRYRMVVGFTAMHVISAYHH